MTPPERMLNEQVGICPVCGGPVRPRDPRRLDDGQLVHAACTPEGVPRDLTATQEQTEEAKQQAMGAGSLALGYGICGFPT